MFYLDIFLKNICGFVLIFSILYILRIIYLYIGNFNILFKNDKSPQLNEIFRISKKEILFTALAVSYIFTYILF